MEILQRGLKLQWSSTMKQLGSHFQYLILISLRLLISNVKLYLFMLI